jgi:hypothetical protein
MGVGAGNDVTEEERIQRANRAQQILNDDLVKEALRGIREDVIQNWQKIPLKDSDLLAKFHMLYGVVDKFEQALRSSIEDGEVATHQLLNDKKRRFGVF